MERAITGRDMPLFHFAIDEGDVHDSDKVGVELPDAAAAAVEAAALAGELLRDRPSHFWRAQAWRLTVEDGGGQPLFTIVVAAHVDPCARAIVAGSGAGPAPAPNSRPLPRRTGAALDWRN